MNVEANRMYILQAKYKENQKKIDNWVECCELTFVLDMQ